MKLPADFDPASDGWTLDDEPGFVELIGPVWTKRQNGDLLFALKVSPKHLNRDGSLHGGMFLAFFDHAIGIVAYEAGGCTRQVTMQLNTHFIRGAVLGEFIKMNSQVVKQTSSYMFMRSTCISQDTILATADGLWKKMRPR